MGKREINYIEEYYEEVKKDNNSRYKSWEHCHEYFIKNKDNINENTLEMMCLHLGFYLASWGMLRNSFLQRKSYRVHYEPIKIMLSDRFQPLFRISPKKLIQQENLKLLFECVKEVKHSYSIQYNCKEPSQTLVTKILLGVYGCTPAYDRYFLKGIKVLGLNQNFSQKSIRQLCQLYIDNGEMFATFENYINDAMYTPMKIVDMLFWQVGFDRQEKKENIDLKINVCYKKDLVCEKVDKIRGKTNNLGKNAVVEILLANIDKAKLEGKSSYIIKSGDLHKQAGLKNALPTACSAIYEVQKLYKSRILHNTPSGMSTTLSVEFYLD